MVGMSLARRSWSSVNAALMGVFSMGLRPPAGFSSAATRVRRACTSSVFAAARQHQRGNQAVVVHAAIPVGSVLHPGASPSRAALASSWYRKPWYSKTGQSLHAVGSRARLSDKAQAQASSSIALGGRQETASITMLLLQGDGDAADSGGQVQSVPGNSSCAGVAHHDLAQLAGLFAAHKIGIEVCRKEVLSMAIAPVTLSATALSTPWRSRRLHLNCCVTAHAGCHSSARHRWPQSPCPHQRWRKSRSRGVRHKPGLCAVGLVNGQRHVVTTTGERSLDLAVPAMSMFAVPVMFPAVRHVAQVG